MTFAFFLKVIYEFLPLLLLSFLNLSTILSLNVSKRLREANLSSMGVKIFVRDNNLFSYEFQSPINNPTQSSIILSEKAIDLFKKKYKWNFPGEALEKVF